jgi:hypothetical protein
MKSLLAVALVFGIGVGPAAAQTSTTSPNTDSTKMNAPGSGAPKTDASQGNSAVKNPTAAQQPSGPASLESGANSFTMEQARSRIEAAGYKNVSDLTKDEQGIWRGKGERDGQQVTVGLDFKGNIANFQ